MKYILYCRKSHEDSSRQVQSIDDQKSVLLEMVERKELNIHTIIEESKTAKKPGRPLFNKMVEMIYEGKAQGIICWKLDRLARNPIDAGTISHMLQQNIIQEIVTPHNRYLPTDNILMLSLELSQANQYIRDLSVNIKRGMKGKAERGGKPGRAPIGYLNDKNTQTIIPDPERFHIIRRAWDEMLSGTISRLALAKKMRNEWKLTTPKTKKQGGKIISTSRVYTMLENPFYYGLFTNAKITYMGNHEAMITKEEFDKVQVMIHGEEKNKNIPRPKNRTEDFPFRGYIFCGCCGGVVTAEEKTKRSKKKGTVKHYTYYYCSKRNNKNGEKCQEPSIRKTKIEKQVLKILEGLYIPQSLIDWGLEKIREQNKEAIEERDASRRRIKKDIKRTAKRLDNLISLKISAENWDGSLLSDEEFKNQKNTITEERIEFEQRLKELGKAQDDWLDTAVNAFDFCNTATERFKNGTFREKRAIFHALGQNFILKDEKLHTELRSFFRVISQGKNDDNTSKTRQNYFNPALETNTQIFPDWQAGKLESRTLFSEDFIEKALAVLLDIQQDFGYLGAKYYLELITRENGG